MADEAVLRIIMEGEEGTGPATTPRGGTPTGTGMGTSPTPPGPSPAPPPAGRTPAPPKPFDPLEVAYERILKEMRQAEVEEAYQMVMGPRDRPLDPAEMTAMYEKVYPDPEKLAQERIEREREKFKVEAAYQNAVAGRGEALPAEETPEMLARKRIEREREKFKVEAAYQNIVAGRGVVLPAEEGDKKGGPLDVVSAVLKHLRLPGGELVGSVGKMLGGEAAAGGAAGAAAGSLGIVAAVVAAEVLLRNALESAVQSVTGFASALSDPGNDPSVIFDNLGESIKKSTAWMIYLGNAIGVVGPVVGDVVASFGELQRNLDGMVTRYAGYSPLLASVTAQAEVTQVLGDLRRAQSAAPDLARYVQARTELQQRYEDIKVEFLKAITPAVITGMRTVELGLPVLRVVVEQLKMVGAAFQPIADVLGDINHKMRENEPSNPEFPTDIIMDQQGKPTFPFELREEGPRMPGRP